MNGDALIELESRLNPCKLCGERAEIDITETFFKTYFNVSVDCKHCHNTIIGTTVNHDGLQAEIHKVIAKWNRENSNSSTIDAQLQGFDDDQKSFVCILLYLAGYKFSPEDLSKYIQHSSINIRETFADMTLEQKSKAFVMIGQTLGYLPGGECKS